MPHSDNIVEQPDYRCPSEWNRRQCSGQNVRNIPLHMCTPPSLPYSENSCFSPRPGHMSYSALQPLSHVRPQAPSYVSPRPSYESPQVFSYNSPQPSSCVSPRSFEYNTPQPSSYNSPQPSSYNSPKPTSSCCNSPQPSSYISPQSFQYNSPQPSSYISPHPSSWSHNSPHPSSAPSVEINPPSWAKAGRGEARLEPVCDLGPYHPSVDLTARPFFRVGRSPASDVPLLHGTSSRRHAIIFHDPSGVCYVLDCNSAHGTYVDGARVYPHPHPPKKVRRGALLRFGGPGAPSFILKSFSVSFDNVVHNLTGVAVAVAGPCHDRHPSDPPISTRAMFDKNKSNPRTETETKPRFFRCPKDWVDHSRKTDTAACVRGDTVGIACIFEKKDAPNAALVLLNTQINALGRGSLACRRRRRLARAAGERFQSMSGIFAVTQHGIKRRREREGQEQGSKKIKSVLVSHNRRHLPHRQTHHIEDGNNRELSPFEMSAVRKRSISFSDERPAMPEIRTVTSEELSCDSEEEEKYSPDVTTKKSQRGLLSISSQRLPSI